MLLARLGRPSPASSAVSAFSYAVKRRAIRPFHTTLSILSTPTSPPLSASKPTPAPSPKAYQPHPSDVCPFFSMSPTTGKPKGTKVSFPGMQAEVLRYSPTVVFVPAKEARKPGEPAVILIMRWMDAADAHAAKYMQHYTSLYPGSTQIVVSAPQKNLWLGELYRERQMDVVVGLLREEGVDVDAKLGEEGGAGLLVHTFSNGGCLSLISLCRRILLLRPTPPSPSLPALPAQAIVYDSCPAPITIRGGATAFSMIFKSPWARWAGWYVIYVLLGLMRSVNGALGYPDSTGRMQEDLLTPELLPEGVPRCYIYSKGDKIVPYQHVEHMIAMERERGRKVEGVRYEETGHVAHVRGDGGRYWAAVRRTWEEGWKFANARKE